MQEDQLRQNGHGIRQAEAGAGGRLGAAWAAGRAQPKTWERSTGGVHAWEGRTAVGWGVRARRKAGVHAQRQVCMVQERRGGERCVAAGQYKCCSGGKYNERAQRSRSASAMRCVLVCH